jgi:hypothetical protein
VCKQGENLPNLVTLSTKPRIQSRRLGLGQFCHRSLSKNAAKCHSGYLKYRRKKVTVKYQPVQQQQKSGRKFLWLVFITFTKLNIKRSMK